jgi:glycosyltransferase involved in cell wall biosynthesis
LPHLYRKILTQLDRVNIQSASLVLTNSAYTRESLYRTYGISARVCYLGVDTQRFRPLPVAKDRFVLSVGALTPHKGFDFLLCSLALMDPAQRPLLVIVSNAGDPREEAYLQNLATQLGVAVEFRTLVSDEELVRLYNQALLTLYTPIMEPFGFVPIESVACSTPVVGVCEGGVRETVLHGETGLLTERDPYEFAEATESLLNDTGRRIQYGNRGRRYVEKQWQWDRCVHDLEKHFANAAQQIRDRVA